VLEWAADGIEDEGSGTEVAHDGQSGIRRFMGTPLFRQILRFGVVGTSAFIIDYGFLYVFTEFCGIEYLISSALSFCISVIFNYIMSIVWVFDVGEQHSRTRDFVVFITLSTIGLGINQLGMWLLVEKAGMWYMLAKIFATAVVMVYNFVTRKLFLERRKPV